MFKRKIDALDTAITEYVEHGKVENPFPSKIFIIKLLLEKLFTLKIIVLKDFYLKIFLKYLKIVLKNRKLTSWLYNRLSHG